MNEKIRVLASDTIQPDMSPYLVPAQTFVFPHGPTNYRVVKVIGDWLEL